jgi:hypothetical protein
MYVVQLPETTMKRILHPRSSGQLEPLVMPNNFTDAQMVIVIHRTIKIIYRSLLVARAAKTVICSLMSFAHSILLRFAAQSFNTARKSFEF